MKRVTAAFVAAAVAVLGAGWASAQQYFSNVGGAQPWDTTTANWGAASGGPYDSVWGSGDAVFEGVAGNVAVGTVSANSLTFSVPAYALTGGVVTLTGPVVSVAAGTVTNTSTLAGTAGLTKTGSGTLVLGGTTNLYSGGTLVSGGTLSVNSDAQLSAAGESLTLAGGTFRNTGALNNFYRPITLGAGGGTINLGTWANFYGAITGGSGLFASGSDFVLQPNAPNDFG